MLGRTLTIVAVVFVLLFPMDTLYGQSVTTVTAKPIEYKSRLFFSPRTYSVTSDSEFEAALYIDTAGFSVNTIDIQISFPPDRVSVVRPVSGESLIDLWITAPKYSNTKGTIEFSGIIPGGIKTSSGLITKIVFRAKSPGVAPITIRKISRVLLNDGFGTDTQVETAVLKLTVEPKIPDGVKVVSDTHPFEGVWYNNNNPVFAWEPLIAGAGYSFGLDDKPFTIPDNEIDGTEPVAGFENLKDGVWYFHIKAKIRNLWTNTTHYTVRIDSMPPAAFTPTVDLLGASDKSRGILSFFTTDALSGISRYEVGILDQSSSLDTSPGLFQTESPYYLPLQMSRDIIATVRAIDQAGNVRDQTIPVHIPSPFLVLIRQYANVLWGGLVVLVILILVSLTFLAGRNYALKQSFSVREKNMERMLEYATRAKEYAPPIRNTVWEAREVELMAPKNPSYQSPVAEYIAPPTAQSGTVFDKHSFASQGIVRNQGREPLISEQQRPPTKPPENLPT